MQQVETRKTPRAHKPYKAHQQHKAHHKEHTAFTPPILLSFAKIAYFIYRDTVYSVANCHSEVFREAVLQLAPHWNVHETYAPILYEDMDIMARWYLLCALSEENKGMQLYTRDEIVSCSQ